MSYRKEMALVFASSDFSLQEAAVAMTRPVQSMVLIHDLRNANCNVMHEGLLDQIRHENDRLTSELVDRVRDSIATQAESTPMSGIPSRAAELANVIGIDACPDFLTSSGYMGELKLHDKKQTRKGKRQMIKYEKEFSIEENCQANGPEDMSHYKRDRSGSKKRENKSANRSKAKAARAARKAAR